jgi:hypothetical protein
MDKNWRPANWLKIKREIVESSPIIFSPSVGYSKDQKNTIIEKTASCMVEAVLKECGENVPDS